MSKPKLRKHFHERIVDSATGEIIDEKVHQYLVGNDTEFFITYCKVIGLMEKLNEGDIKTLAWLVSNLQFNSNMVSASVGIKKKIAEEMGIGVSTVSNALVRLVRHNILYREKGGGERDAIYFIHPEYFWKGDIAERNRKLKYVMQIGIEKASEYSPRDNKENQ